MDLKIRITALRLLWALLAFSMLAAPCLAVTNPNEAKEANETEEVSIELSELTIERSKPRNPKRRNGAFFQRGRTEQSPHRRLVATNDFAGKSEHATRNGLGGPLVI